MLSDSEMEEIMLLLAEVYVVGTACKYHAYLVPIINPGVQMLKIQTLVCSSSNNGILITILK